MAKKKKKVKNPLQCYFLKAVPDGRLSTRRKTWKTPILSFGRMTVSNCMFRPADTKGREMQFINYNLLLPSGMSYRLIIFYRLCQCHGKRKPVLNSQNLQNYLCLVAQVTTHVLVGPAQHPPHSVIQSSTLHEVCGLHIIRHISSYECKMDFHLLHKVNKNSYQAFLTF